MLVWVFIIFPKIHFSYIFIFLLFLYYSTDTNVHLFIVQCIFLHKCVLYILYFHRYISCTIIRLCCCLGHINIQNLGTSWRFCIKFTFFSFLFFGLEVFASCISKEKSLFFPLVTFGVLELAHPMRSHAKQLWFLPLRFCENSVIFS